MIRPFRFGVQCMEFGDLGTVRETARQCAEFGYDEFFTADHLGHADPFLPLIIAATEAPDVRVGPLVINNALHNPALLARAAATADRMTNGRVILGLGTGFTRSEHDAVGITLHEPGPRVSQFEEAVVALRALLDAGAYEHDGEHYQLAVDDLGVRPIQERLPLLIGGNGRRLVGIAGRHADIFQYMGASHDAAGTLNPENFRLADVRQRSEWLRAAAGDRSDDVECSALVQRTSVGAGADSSAQETQQKWGLDEAELADCPFALIGSVEQLVDKIERLRELVGITHYVVRDPEGFAPVVEALRHR